MSSSERETRYAERFEPDECEPQATEHTPPDGLETGDILEQLDMDEDEMSLLIGMGC